MNRSSFREAYFHSTFIQVPIKIKTAAHMTTQTEYTWLSPLGISVMLFMLHGTFYIVIGILTPFFWNKPISEKPGLIISYSTDKELFGDEPKTIFRENKPVYKLSQITLSMISGLLVIAGICLFSLALFGLRDGHTWAFYVLAGAGLAALPFWWLVFQPYFEAGIRITLADAPPFIWVPTMVYLPAIILGWIGLK